MAKDPAFLFYPGDWQGGTSTFTRHLKGCYIDILIAQFNSGPLSIDEIKTVLNNDFAAWGTLIKKFKKTETGLFFNERLEIEKEKRKEFSKKQTDKVNKRWGKNTNVYTTVIPEYIPKKENRNEDENRNEFEIGGAGERGGIIVYSPEKLLEELENSKWLNELAVHFKITPASCLDKLNEFASELKVKEGYSRNLADIKTHFFNWLNIKIKNNKNEPGKANIKAHAGKGAGSF